MMGIIMPETCWAVSVRQSNKILRLIVASSWVFYLSDSILFFFGKDLFLCYVNISNKVSQKQHFVDFIVNKIVLSLRRRCMFHPVRGPSSGETNTMYAKEGNVIMKVNTWKEFIFNRSNVLVPSRVILFLINIEI